MHSPSDVRTFPTDLGATRRFFAGHFQVYRAADRCKTTRVVRYYALDTSRYTAEKCAVVSTCRSTPLSLTHTHTHTNANSTPSFDLLTSGSVHAFQALSCLFLQILSTVAFLFFFRTDSTDSPDCLPILLSISVFFSFFPTF